MTRETPPDNSIAALSVHIPPVPSTCPVHEVGSLLFLTEKYQSFLSLPVVDNNEPVGVISRYELTKIYVKQFGRELYGKQPVSNFMNPKPLIIDAALSMESASQYITKNISHPVTEDFIVISDNKYMGVGIVLDLLGAMEKQVARRNKLLAKAFADLKASQAHLVQSEKMASLGQMVAGVAHEINTPLGYVRNNVETIQGLFGQTQELVNAYQSLVKMLTDSDANEEELHTQLGLIEELGAPFSTTEMINEMNQLFNDSLFGVDQIAELVMNLKDFSRLDRSKVENVNIHDCIESSLNIGRNNLKYKVTVKKEFGEIPNISCSPSQLNQVFLNLFTNAAQAIEDKGTLQIKTYADETFVYISVQDSGKGIPKEVIPKIFDPFFTTKPIGQGTGLGLSICFQIIKSHDGKIQVASEMGKGTRFLISLPHSPQKIAKVSNT
jgi:two-component system, NtrC family, sensor kinase